jgi:hypothetical protein
VSGVAALQVGMMNAKMLTVPAMFFDEDNGTYRQFVPALAAAVQDVPEELAL